MKVVIAATPEQENHIQELVGYFYSNIFPNYFTDEEIIKFKELNVMSLNGVEENYNGTLKEAFQLISSLQAIIAVLDAIRHKPIGDDDQTIFDRNVHIIKGYGIDFPFSLNHFATSKPYMISQFQKPFNLFLA